MDTLDLESKSENKNGHIVDYDLCPNCITPWKCNGPHIPRKHWGRYFPEIYNFLYSLLT